MSCACDFHAIKLRCGVCGVRFHEFARDAPLVLQLLCGVCSHCSNLFVVFKSIIFCPFPVFHISICIVSTMSFPHVVAIRVADVCFPLGCASLRSICVLHCMFDKHLSTTCLATICPRRVCPHQLNCEHGLLFVSPFLFFNMCFAIMIL